MGSGVASKKMSEIAIFWCVLSFLCTFLPFVGVFGQYLTFIDEFCSFSVITGEKLVTNCNFRPYIWIFWCFQPVSGELRPSQWS